jgi:hypothetical protein
MQPAGRYSPALLENFSSTSASIAVSSRLIGSDDRRPHWPHELIGVQFVNFSPNRFEFAKLPSIRQLSERRCWRRSCGVAVMPLVLESEQFEKPIQMGLYMWGARIGAM